MMAITTVATTAIIITAAKTGIMIVVIDTLIGATAMGDTRGTMMIVAEIAATATATTTTAAIVTSARFLCVGG